MDVYVTTKNSGPSWGRDPLHIEYIGTSFEKAHDAVEFGFRKYKVEDINFWTRNDPTGGIWSAIPYKMPRQMVSFYTADGWWYSIVKIELMEEK